MLLRLSWLTWDVVAVDLPDLPGGEVAAQNHKPSPNSERFGIDELK
jgi:hypothetical protein